MPRFSIIVPTHAVEPRLPLALDSVLAQPFGDFELIPVHDTTDSPAGTITHTYATRDTRVALTQSPPSAGLSGARNAGLTTAHGTYILFLDGDDTLAPNALQSIADALTESDDPDVLYLAHERTPWWEGSATLVPPDGAHTPAWSAAYRRDFLTEHHLTFPSGHYTDLAWGGLVALAARRTAELRNTTGVRHLTRRQGNRLDAPGDHQLDLLDQVELVLARATAENSLSAEMFTRLFDIVLRTAAHPTRVPLSHRRAFFHRAGQLHGHYRPTDLRPPTGRRALQHRLLASGSYTAFRALSGVDRWATGALTALPRRHTLLTRAYYAAQRRLPLDKNLAVHLPYGAHDLACDPTALHARARELAPHIRPLFLVEPEAAGLPVGVDHALVGTRRYWKALARAKYVVGNVDSLGSAAPVVVKRPGSVHVRTAPGTPLTTTGVDRAPYPLAAAAVAGSRTGLLDSADHWDFCLSANRHSTQTWERAFPGTYETLEYGSPRNDVFYTATEADVARARRELGIPEDRKALLYAPAHRDRTTGFDADFGPGGEARLDLEAFREAVGEEFVVLRRPHPPYGPHPSHGRRPSPSPSASPSPSPSPSLHDLCLAADALITDHSPLMFDYAHLDRPIVVHAEDWEVFRETRGVCLDLPSVAPGHVARTERELADLFRDGSYADGESAALRAEFRELFCRFDDGRAAERVVRRVFLGERPENLPPLIPLAERTPAPAPTPRRPSFLVRS
ncbi:bifunctional glycosyltransferase/CDP-glycerol:glycerophosphate glycerophosphotransferase [Streptomyces sp. NPDC002643]